MSKNEFRKDNKPVVGTENDVLVNNERGVKLSRLNAYIQQAKAFKENDFNDTQIQTAQPNSTKDYKKKIK